MGCRQHSPLIHLDRFSSQNKECLRSLCQKPRELVHQYVLDLVGLLDFYAKPYAVDTRLNEYALVFISGYSQRIKEELGRCGSFNLGYIVALRHLRGEVREGEGGG